MRRLATQKTWVEFPGPKDTENSYNLALATATEGT